MEQRNWSHIYHNPGSVAARTKHGHWVLGLPRRQWEQVVAATAIAALMSQSRGGELVLDHIRTSLAQASSSDCARYSEEACRKLLSNLESIHIG